MIGDVINLEQRHLETAENIYKIIKQNNGHAEKRAIGICGESGSGKSVTAYALKKVLEENNITSYVIQMDDYFKLPPKSNHENRQKSLDNVGMGEVHLDIIQENIQHFKEGISGIEKPLVHYQNNTISKEAVDLENVEVLIVEGTYILNIDAFDFSIFIDRNYKDTYEDRMDRNRDEQSDFVEKVLDIEHNIIHQFKEKADIILGKNYQIVKP
ncbi:uridine kinase family protein [Chryseobacterium sp. GP-SGM7]|uniref:uridine kinase family protein n=1 Tax=Chryseobacterium sp. GP-SGM7 TaxID=3411323 RepID=UPI003B92B1CD